MGEPEQSVGAAGDDHVIVEAAVEDVDAVVDDLAADLAVSENPVVSG